MRSQRSRHCKKRWHFPSVLPEHAQAPPHLQSHILRAATEGAPHQPQRLVLTPWRRQRQVAWAGLSAGLAAIAIGTGMNGLRLRAELDATRAEIVTYRQALPCSTIRPCAWYRCKPPRAHKKPREALPLPPTAVRPGWRSTTCPLPLPAKSTVWGRSQTGKTLAVRASSPMPAVACVSSCPSTPAGKGIYDRRDH